MKMKKKLLFFITCFFLFFSLTAFFVYLHLRSPEVPKKENNEEVKKEETDKITDSKDNLNKEEEKKKEEKPEETDDLPWTFTWIGAIFSLILSFVIALIMAFVIYVIVGSCCHITKKKENTINLFSLMLFWIFLYLVAFPLLFAIQKYKDKSYGERFWLANFSSRVKIIFNIIVLALLTFFTIVEFCCNEDKGMGLKEIEPQKLKNDNGETKLFNEKN